MTIVNLSLSEIHDLALEAFTQNGCDPQNAGALTRTVVAAERDGSHSHGLFRVPGYVASLRSGKVNGAADPQISNKSPVIVNANGDDGYAPLAIERGIPALAKAASEFGIAVMTLTHTHHFAALWPEDEALAEQNLAGMACVSYMPNVAPHGSNKPLFGTNPLAFAWPRKTNHHLYSTWQPPQWQAAILQLPQEMDIRSPLELDWMKMAMKPPIRRQS